MIREPEQLRKDRPVLEAINVYKSYRRGDHVVTALNGVTLTVSAGERVVLWGRLAVESRRGCIYVELWIVLVKERFA